VNRAEWFSYRSYSKTGRAAQRRRQEAGWGQTPQSLLLQ